MKLKDGHTYVTRSGVKRKVKPTNGTYYAFCGKAIDPTDMPGSLDIWTDKGRYIGPERKHKWDLVKEYKRAK